MVRRQGRFLGWRAAVGVSHGLECRPIAAARLPGPILERRANGDRWGRTGRRSSRWRVSV